MRTIIIHKSDLTDYAISLGVWNAILESIELDTNKINHSDDDRIELDVKSGCFNRRYIKS